MILDFLHRNFSRKVSEERDYIAAADGIRFWATIHVIFGHILVYLTMKNPTVFQNTPFDFIYYFIATPGLGLEIFFVLSGFLLILPFAEYHLHGNRKPNTALYYLRRLVRLEVPYVIALTVSALALVFVLKKVSFQEMLPEYIASFFYANHYFYGGHPMPLPIAWSLEAEVQFYILVPVLAFIFKINKLFRRVLLLISVVIIPIIIKQSNVTDAFFFLQFFQFFFAGILLADFYLDKELLAKLNKDFLGLIAVLLLMPIFHIIRDKIYQPIIYLLPLVISFFLYVVLKKDAWHSLFHNKYLRMIGCMCYSIYLWHYMVISVLGPYTIQLQISNLVFVNFLIQILLLAPPILIIAALYFKFIERPCMYSDASKRILKWFKR